MHSTTRVRTHPDRTNPDRTNPDPTRGDLTASLADGVARLTTSCEWERYLDYQTVFPRYSFGNVLLIAAQYPGATRVAGFSTWRSLGRWVRRGESAIWIFAPLRRRASGRHQHEVVDEGAVGREASEVTGFRRVAVFDVAQTDGTPAPEVVHRLVGPDRAGTYPRLSTYARSLGYVVDDVTLDGVSNGECDFARRRIRVEVRNAPAQRTKTLAHELAHALLHEHESDRALAELEAESIAYLVCRAVGLDTGEYSFGYVASWAGGGDAALLAIRRSGERISRTAKVVIDVIAPDGGVVRDRPIPFGRSSRASLRSA
jgi:hypothetical protein